MTSPSPLPLVSAAASAWLAGTPNMTESRREALAAAPMPTSATDAGGNTTELTGLGPGEKDEAFSKLKDKFMNQLKTIPRE